MIPPDYIPQDLLVIKTFTNIWKKIYTPLLDNPSTPLSEDNKEERRRRCRGVDQAITDPH